jgi:hypothetical protein
LKIRRKNVPGRTGKRGKIELSEKEARFIGILIIVLFLACVGLASYVFMLRSRIERYMSLIQELETRVEKLSAQASLVTFYSSPVISYPDVESVVSTESTEIYSKLNASTSTGVEIVEEAKFDFNKYFEGSTDFVREGEKFIVIKDSTETVFRLIVDTNLPYFITRNSTNFSLVLIGRGGINPIGRIPMDMNVRYYDEWYTVQLLAHPSSEAVKTYVKYLRGKGYPAIDYIFRFAQKNTTLHALVLGIFTDLKTAEDFSKQLDEKFLADYLGEGIKRRFIRQIK